MAISRIAWRIGFVLLLVIAIVFAIEQAADASHLTAEICDGRCHVYNRYFQWWCRVENWYARCASGHLWGKWTPGSPWVIKPWGWKGPTY